MKKKRKGRLIWDKQLPVSSQVKIRLRKDLLTANSYLKGTYFLVVADETASIESS